MTKNFLLILSALMSVFSSAHAKDIDWFQNTAFIEITPQWLVHAEIQPRWIEGYQSTQSILLRAAVLYSLDSEWRFGLGMGHTPQFLPYVRNENRIYQQVDWLPKTSGALEFSTRIRLEERFLERTSGISWRTRAKVQLNWMPGRFGAYVWDECFLNLNTKPGEITAGFDQNRISFGPRYKFSPVILEVGVIIQTLLSARKITTWNNGALVNLGLRF